MDPSYNIIRIQQYLQGQLSPEEMHRVEREALEDPFLNDAIEGYRLQDGVVHHGQLSLLQKRLATRIETQRRERNQFYFSGQRLGIAATACVLFLLGVLLFWMRSSWWTDASHGESASTLKQVEVELPGANKARTVNTLRLNMTALNRPGEPIGTPAAGWEEFQKYLADHADWSGVAIDSLPPTGTQFSVSFDIDKRGRPLSVQVDSLHPAGIVPLSIRKEISRLIEVGPAWEGQKSTLQVAFFYRD